MRTGSVLGSLLLLSVLAVYGCGDDEERGSPSNSGGSAGQGGSNSKGGSSSGGSGPVSVSLDGSVQKGPFLLGSSVGVSTIGATGDPTGQVFNTETTDDLGSFDFTLDYQGGVSIEGSGYYYNELTGELSASDLTLRAYYDVTTEGSQDAYVNLLTHLIHGRVKALLKSSDVSGSAGAGSADADGGGGGEDGVAMGSNLAAAIAQAEKELIAELGVGGPDFDPGVSATAMNMVGVDNDADAYLFAVSVIFVEIARSSSEMGGGTIEAELQELLNRSASAFAADGTLPSDVKNQISYAQTVVDIDWVMQLSRGRLGEVDAGGNVPDLHRVWDGDADGIVDVNDNCPRIANPDQEIINDVCGYTPTYPSTYQSGGASDLLLMGDFDGDTHVDVLRGGYDGLHVFPGNGDGTFGMEITSPLALHNAFPDNLLPQAIDVDGDGDLDFVANAANSSGTTGVYLNDGSGAFAEAVLVVSTPIAYDAGAVDTLVDYAVLDADADGLRDFVGAIGGGDKLYVLINQDDGTWGGEIEIVLPDPVVVTDVLSADFDDDGNPDLAVASQEMGTSPGGLYLLWGLGSTSAPFFDVDAGISGAAGYLGGLVTGDVVGTPDLDIVLSVSAGVVVLEGDGSRGFGTPISVSAFSEGGAVAIGDVTGDGKNDLIAGQGVHIGDGTTFTMGTAIDLWDFNTSVKHLAVGDTNGDGVTDVAAQLQTNSTIPFDFVVWIMKPSGP